MTTQASDIQVRALNFNLESAARGPWNPTRPELSHAINAVQLALPYLEPYFIDAIKQALPQIEDPKLRADAQAFCSQEANHARQHRRYCRLLQMRYPRLAEFEAATRQLLMDSRKHDPLNWRLAYTAGYEAVTAQVSRMLLRLADDWFEGVDPQFAEMFKWHAAEEIEHRHVAFDVLQAVDPRYGLRAKGILVALKQTYSDMIPIIHYMLKVDGSFGTLDSHIRGYKLRAQFFRHLVPSMVRYLLPGYHPSQDPEPVEYANWKREHAQVEVETLAAS